MKTLYLVGGTMGVGKTTACRALQKKLDDCVFLDGDWCWDMRPFRVTEETKAMVMENICFQLNNFLACSAFCHVIFCWVMHEEAMITDILSRLFLDQCRVVRVSLTARVEVLRARLLRDVERGIRLSDVIDRSLKRLPLYDRLDTVKIDTSDMTPNAVADAILALA